MSRRRLGLVLEILGVILLATLLVSGRPAVAEGRLGLFGYLLFVMMVFLIGIRLARGKGLPISRRNR
jgi:hypothetical protein